jgi:alpha-L-fucosidase
MKRRDFCRMMAAAAAATAVPSGANAEATTPPPETHAAASPSVETPEFGKLTQTYSQFCATPAHDRVFYALVDGKIVSQKLDDAAWKPTAWGDPPALPVPGGSWDGVPMIAPVSGLAGEGPYQPNWDSLLQYDAPDWYRDAKFGIWAHWSPQCVPEDGDWYGRNLYIEGNPQNLFHLDHYGPPSRFGYKDLCPQWTLLNWDPDALIERYKNAGARFFIALANHHDGFDTWASKHQPWNASAIGPHRDVVGAWAKAARAQGLRLGVTVHQGRNWWWFQPSHGKDSSGPLAGVPYDGCLYAPQGNGQWWQALDPQRLYSAKHPFDALPDASYVKNFYDRTRDLIDQHDPDLLYFDNPRVPLGWGGMNLAAYFYNHNIQTHGGKLEAVLTGKEMPPHLRKALVADIERGLTSNIMPYAWQSETCIGNWHYDRALYNKPGRYGGYLPPRDVIHWLIDTVSKNGTFILNIPGKPDGTIDSKEIAVLDGIAAWMQANGDAIYETRPWKIYGEGPHAVKTGSFQGNSIGALGEKDIRFTRSKDGRTLYAIALGWPSGPFTIQALGSQSLQRPGRIENVELLGTQERVQWKQLPGSLHLQLPENYRPAVNYAAALKVIVAPGTAAAFS